VWHSNMTVFLIGGEFQFSCN